MPLLHQTLTPSLVKLTRNTATMKHLATCRSHSCCCLVDVVSGSASLESLRSCSRYSYWWLIAVSASQQQQQQQQLQRPVHTELTHSVVPKVHIIKRIYLQGK